MSDGQNIQTPIKLSAEQAQAVGPVASYYVEEVGLNLEEAQSRATLDGGFGETSPAAQAYVAKALRAPEPTRFGANGDLPYADVYGGGSFPAPKPSGQ